MSRRAVTFLSVNLSLVFAFTAVDALAIPAWSRKYHTSCSTCHVAFPKLNYFGKAFRNNGYRFPAGQDPEGHKETPVSMGAEGYKKLFPRALGPRLPGVPPLAVRAVSALIRAPYPGRSNHHVRVPHEFELLTGGTLGETFCVLRRAEVENEANENELGNGRRPAVRPAPLVWISRPRRRLGLGPLPSTTTAADRRALQPL